MSLLAMLWLILLVVSLLLVLCVACVVGVCIGAVVVVVGFAVWRVVCVVGGVSDVVDVYTLLHNNRYVIYHFVYIHNTHNARVYDSSQS